MDNQSKKKPAWGSSRWAYLFRFPYTPLDLQAHTAGILGLMVGMPITMVLFALILLLLGVDIPENGKGTWGMVLALVCLAVPFGLGFACYDWAARRVYRRNTLPCRHCGKQPLSYRKNQKRERTGNCPICGRSMFTLPEKSQETSSAE